MMEMLKEVGSLAGDILIGFILGVVILSLYSFLKDVADAGAYARQQMGKGKKP